MKSIERHSDEPVRQKICVLFPGALGDFICFMPALQSLAQQATVDLFAQSAFSELVVDGIRVSSLESTEVSELFRNSPKTCGLPGRFLQAYDAVYSWFASGNPDFVELLQVLTGGRAQIFPFRPTKTDIHQRDYYLRCIGEKNGSSAAPLIVLRPQALRWRDCFWSQNSLDGGPVLTIAPGSGSREKNWPVEFFTDVVRWWRESTAGAVIVLVGPVEEERGGMDGLCGDAVTARNLSLSQVAAVLSRSDVYLGNDSGISHLAAALDIRTVALFGPSDHRQWAPRGRKVTVLRRGLACSPCHELIMKGCPHRACLTKFVPQEIILALECLPEVVTLTR
jgi:ADP-heptose:LPS heptosyltransferase